MSQLYLRMDTATFVAGSFDLNPLVMASQATRPLSVYYKALFHQTKTSGPALLLRSSVRGASRVSAYSLNIML